MGIYEFIEHTADVAVRVTAPTLSDLFITAAESLFFIIVDFQCSCNYQKKINLTEHSLEELLVSWLSELNYRFYAEKFLPCEYSLSIEKETDDWRLIAVVSGKYFDPFSQTIKTEIKAVTYSDLKIENAENGFETKIVFDV